MKKLLLALLLAVSFSSNASNLFNAAATEDNTPAALNTSLEFSLGNYATLAEAPDMFTGVLFTNWTKNPQTVGYPYIQPNKSPFTIFGSDWFIWAITGNMYTNTTDASHSGFNSNITLWGGMGDYLGIILDTTPEAQSLDWVFNAWQFVFSGTTASDTLTMRQWIRWGFLSSYVYTENVLTVAEIRTLISDPTWTPSAATSISFGTDNGFDGATFNMTKMKIYERATKPTEVELTNIMLQTAPDATAWADYNMEWSSGAAVLTDGSGNGRTLTEVGSLAEGLDAAGANYAGTPYIRQSTPVRTVNGSATVAATFETAPTVGNHIIAEAATAITSSDPLPTIADDQSNSYTFRTASDTSGWFDRHSHIGFAEVGTSGSTTVTISGLTFPQFATVRAHEWVGINTAQPEDFYAVVETGASPLTITAGSASTMANVIGVSVVTPDVNGLFDYTVYPAGWNTIQGTTAITGGVVGTGIRARHLFTSAGTHSVTWPAQAASENLTGIFVGFRPN